ELLAQGERRLSSYASVCREWQSVMEEHTFRRLKLRVSCLDEFERAVVGPRRRYVKHVWLNIEFRPYTCRVCQSPLSEKWKYRDTPIMGQAISRLFSILGTWPSATDELTVEFSAQSPSDSQHWFKDYHFGAHGADEARDLLPVQFHDPVHYWENGRQLDLPPKHALWRLYGRSGVRLQPEPATVPAVTGLVIRRQCRNRILPKTLQEILFRLGRLKCLVYEPWRVGEYFLPRNVKRLSLFEDFSEDYLRQCPVEIQRRTPNRAVGEAFARRSIDLEQLSVSFIIDACDFFRAHQHDLTPWTWNHLQSLVLTSPLLAPLEHRLAPDATPERISAFLREAAAAALRMPRLEIMALWNYLEGDGGVLIYTRDMRDPVLTLQSTWGMMLEPEVREAWTEVPSRYTPVELRFPILPLLDVVRSRGDFIQQLNLPPGVLDPGSLSQMRREGRSYR
ncbi:hypothetical protein BO78DRAFT_275387, partial [Aspergillus sclerotiicarbonarius CBS 121057]